MEAQPSVTMALRRFQLSLPFEIYNLVFMHSKVKRKNYPADCSVVAWCRLFHKVFVLLFFLCVCACVSLAMHNSSADAVQNFTGPESLFSQLPAFCERCGLTWTQKTFEQLSLFQFKYFCLCFCQWVEKWIKQCLNQNLLAYVLMLSVYQMWSNHSHRVLMEQNS